MKKSERKKQLQSLEHPAFHGLMLLLLLRLCQEAAKYGIVDADAIVKKERTNRRKTKKHAAR